MEFLTDCGVVIALVCAGAAVVYGVVTTQRAARAVARQRAMQEISGAVQEGAKAYLTPPVHDHRRRRASCSSIVLDRSLQDVDGRRSAS